MEKRRWPNAKWLPLVAATLLTFGLVAGCKAVVIVEMGLKELLSGKSDKTTATLALEVTGCEDFQDSRKLSTAVLEAQQTVPLIFPGAKYADCYRQQFNSYARFQLPVTIDRISDGKLSSESQLNLLASDKILLGLGVPASIRDNLKRQKERSMAASALDLSFVVKLKNDTGADRELGAIAAYVADRPYLSQGFKFPKNGEATIRPSNVSIDHALETGSVAILFPSK